MPRALLINPPIRVRARFVDTPYFVNMGLLGGAAVLREAGWDVRVVDAFALASSTWAGGLMGAAVADVERALPAEPFDAIVIGANVFLDLPLGNRDVARLVDAARERWPAARIVLADGHVEGMYYADYDAEAVLARHPEADAIARYECEGSLTFALAPHAPRIVVPRADPDPDALPPPAWDLIDGPAYQRFLARVFGARDRAGPFGLAPDGATLPVSFSRGCVHRCHFCSHSPRARAAAEAPRWRRLSLPRIEALVDHLVATRGARKLVLLDAMANLDEARFERILELLAARDLRFDLPNGLRADRLSERQVALMKGRVDVVSVSAESGVQRVVDDVVGKDLDLACITRAAATCARHGVALMVHWMVGLPGETRAEASATFDAAARLYEQHRALPLVQFPTPLPGTRLHRDAAAAGAFVDGAPHRPRDWGALFQAEPVLHGGAGGASPDELLRARDVLAARLRAARHRKLIVNLTYRCNNHCVFCATGDRPSIDGDAAAHARLLADYRAQGYALVDFDGGEPTLHPELAGIVATAARLGYERINVTTNGRRLMYEALARRVTHAGLTDILFSIHGPDAATHGDLVADADAFAQTLAGLRAVMRVKPAHVEVGINTTLGRRNVGSLVEMGALAVREGVRRLAVQFITPFGRAHGAHTPDPAAGAAAVRRLLDAYGDRLDVQVINLPFCFLPGHTERLTGDVGKSGRVMAFVGERGVNLGEYLAERRHRTPACDDCVYRFACKGFYDTGEGARASAARHAAWAAAQATGTDGR